MTRPPPISSLFPSPPLSRSPGPVERAPPQPPNPPPPLRFVFDHIERRNGGRGLRGRERRRIDEGARPVHEVLNQVSRPRYEAAEPAKRLAESPHLHERPALQSEVFHRPPTSRAHDAGPVRVVHDHRSAGLLRYLVELRKRSQIPVHAEHAVRDDQRGAGSPSTLQEPRQLRLVPVAIHPP